MTTSKSTQDQLPVLAASAASREVATPSVETGVDSPQRAGIIIAVLVFGVFGLWAALAPIEGAAHAPGIVMVKSYKKVVQHLEGGIVNDILAQNGDHVATGAPIMVLDSTQSQAQLEIVNAQMIALMAMEARLIAERDNLPTVVYPAALLNGNANAIAEMEAQTQIFQARTAARDGGIAVLEQRIEQLKSRLIGLEAMRTSKLMLAESFSDELDDVRALLKEGFADKMRLRDVERNYAMQSGEAAELLATISSTEMQIGETRLQILQMKNEFLAEVANNLSETQTRLKDSRERTTALTDIVERAVIRAPVDGVINGLQIHTIGAVIGPGTPVAEIVPQTDELIIEARVSVLDIDRVSIGQDATISFSSFGRKVPHIMGNVINVSADTLTDQATGAPYYQARVAVTPEGVTTLGDLVLVPGMPAEVFINSGSRTFLQYVFKPFSSALARSLIED
ncbi:MAG: HlyD family type I secretion periplasmic adaptor subunit [Gammaproteobacteria bacterium]|nr:HlyD family type I secretion periplasmic adaptor subunit [Gammaproteobacteria bacterium]MDP2348933.1 HlyD family type I secretion periplasmic adaptor subunit [Gammaproteobacteria bacterium]